MSSQPRVLIVEDNVLRRNLLAQFLQQEGCSVLVAASRRDACRLTESFDGSIDLLVSHLALPHSHLLAEDFAHRSQSVLLPRPKDHTSFLPDEWKQQILHALSNYRPRPGA